LDVDDLSGRENLNGYADLDGCLTSSKSASSAKDRARRAGSVRDQSVQIRSESNKLLERLAKLLNEHPEYTEISVDGHTDERGPKS
jgi:flagellar motor protein MotB